MQFDMPDSGRSQGRVSACPVCSLQPACLSWNLEPGEVENLDAIVEQATPLGDGDHLFRAGDALRAIYAVRTGAFKSYACDGNGRPRVIGFHFPGELAGLDGVYSHCHASSAVALGDSTVCVLPYDDLTALMASNQGLREQILRVVDRDIRANGKANADLGAEQRLAAFLIDLSRRILGDSGSAIRFALPMKPRDIASYLRLDPDALGQTFAGFAASGLIAFDGDGIRLLNLSELDRIAGAAR